MDYAVSLLLGPFLTLAFSILVMIANPWLLPIFAAPWIVLLMPLQDAACKANGYRAVLKRSLAGRLWVNCGLMIILAHLGPLISQAIAAMTGKLPGAQVNIASNLASGSCMSGMTLFTVVMALLCGVGWQSAGVRHGIVMCCCVPAIALDVYYLYEIAGSDDGQAALVYCATPILGHVVASAIASLFAALPFLRWWKQRRLQHESRGPV